jgi:hypothetical protein
MNQAHPDWTELQKIIKKLVAEKNLSKEEAQDHQNLLTEVFKLTEWEKHPSKQ